MGAMIGSWLCGNAFAIEGLQIKVKSSNVVLSWPSTNTETYLVQYRPTLTPDSSWITLTDYMAAATSSNITSFVHSNIVKYPPASTNTTHISGGPPAPGAMVMQSEPVVTSSNGSSVPLALYPPGFNLGGLAISDPVTKESVVAANGDTVKPLSTSSSTFAAQANSSSSTTVTQYTGFYRVIRDGVHIFGLTNNSIVSGVLQLPIELSLTNADQVTGIAFYDQNNSPVIGATAQGSGNNWTLTWNTPMVFNGTNTIYAEVDFSTNDPVVGLPVSVTVSNLISYPNYFTQIYGNQMWIYAQTVPNAPYQLDMYDDTTNYLGSFTGNADTNGTISFLWGLYDYQGNLSTSTNFTGVYTVTLNPPTNQVAMEKVKITASPLAKKTLTNVLGGPHPNDSSPTTFSIAFWAQETYWVPNNNWVVAYGLFSSDASIQAADKNMMNGGAAGEYGGVLGTLDPYGLNGNMSPGNNCIAGNVFTLMDGTTKTNLLGYLADYKYENFYFFGHGNSTAIGAYNGWSLTYDLICSKLKNVPLSYRITQSAYHPYRFVVLDGCDTGAGKLSEAFAVPASQIDTNFFGAQGLESRACIAYKKWKLANISSSNWENYSGMTGEFLDDWLVRAFTVQTCVSNALNDVYTSGAKMDSSVVIYGATNMYVLTHTRTY